MLLDGVKPVWVSVQGDHGGLVVNRVGTMSTCFVGWVCVNKWLHFWDRVVMTEGHVASNERRNSILVRLEVVRNC